MHRCPGIAILALGTLVAGCSQQSGSPLPLPTTFIGQTAFRSLHSFDDLDASLIYPRGGLVAVDGALYGTTYGHLGTGRGGAAGTVFELVQFSAGSRPAVKVVHRFEGADASHPESNLLALGKNLYGSTYWGGTNNAGAMFEVSTSGVERVVYAFDGPDGKHPSASPIAVNGKLYGTTQYGGTANAGTVFEVNPTGEPAQRVVLNFQGVSGANPFAALLAIDGKLYGTTYWGGAHNAGTVFSVNPVTGAKRVLHSFKGPDGKHPLAGLIELNGALYGTTYWGGAHNAGSVFEVRLSGEERVVYSFKGDEGKHPVGTLVAMNGILYGTTQYGGTFGCAPPIGAGCGTVFGVTTAGVETVLHSFNGGDGKWPFAGLTALGGALYGTTEKGGNSARPAGTIFEVTP
jgi:uncharacterized repeat protein (TIGR03803 family)